MRTFLAVPSPPGWSDVVVKGSFPHLHVSFRASWNCVSVSPPGQTKQIVFQGFFLIIIFLSPSVFVRQFFQKYHNNKTGFQFHVVCPQYIRGRFFFDVEVLIVRMWMVLEMDLQIAVKSSQVKAIGIGS